jgi:putative protease
MNQIAPELLAPAGTLKNMRYAFAYGADAVYAGQPRYSLRVRNNEFDHANLALGIREAQAQGKRFYVVVNIAPHNAKLKTFLKDLAPVIAMAPDALIMSDPGLIMLVRRHFPQMPIHLSVQANTVNWASVEFWQQQGLSRIILSRELSLEEIAEIRQQVPAMELEVFVHGALCMAYSGRCLLSGYLNKRDANQGSCTNACRWKSAQEATENTLGEIVQQFQPEPTLGLGAHRAGVPAARGQSPRRTDAGLRRRAWHLHHECQGPARRTACRAPDADGCALAENRRPDQIAFLLCADHPGLPTGHR